MHKCHVLFRGHAGGILYVLKYTISTGSSLSTCLLTPAKNSNRIPYISQCKANFPLLRSFLCLFSELQFFIFFFKVCTPKLDTVFQWWSCTSILCRGNLPIPLSLFSESLLFKGMSTLWSLYWHRCVSLTMPAQPPTIGAAYIDRVFFCLCRNITYPNYGNFTD